jgi:hypothetical protein
MELERKVENIKKCLFCNSKQETQTGTATISITTFVLGGRALAWTPPSIGTATASTESIPPPESNAVLFFLLSSNE